MEDFIILIQLGFIGLAIFLLLSLRPLGFWLSLFNKAIRLPEDIQDDELLTL